MPPMPSLALLLALAHPSLGACPAARPAGADWPQFRGDAAQRGVAQGSLAGAFEKRWAYEAGGPITSSPVVANGLVYFGSDDQKLHAVELATGRARWTFETEDMIEAPPMVHAGTVYVGSNDFFLYALDAASGERRWRFEAGDKFLGAAVPVPAPEGDGYRVVCGSYDTNLYCLDPSDGRELWRYGTDNYVNGTPAIDELGRIVFGGCDAVLHVVSARTGEALQRLELGEACHVAGSVALDAGRAYFGHYGNAFVCVDLAGPKVAWSYTDPDQAFFSSPAVLAERVVFGGRDKELHCVAKADGKELWSFKTRRKVDGSPVACGDKVVFGSGDGWLYVLALEDGRELWSYEIGAPIMTSPAVVAGEILIGANDGRLYCFAPAAEEGGERER